MTAMQPKKRRDVSPTRRSRTEDHRKDSWSPCENHLSWQIGEQQSDLFLAQGKLSSAAAFTVPVEIMRAKELSRLTANIRHFFEEFRDSDLSDISERQIQIRKYEAVEYDAETLDD